MRCGGFRFGVGGFGEGVAWWGRGVVLSVFELLTPISSGHGSTRGERTISSSAFPCSSGFISPSSLSSSAWVVMGSSASLSDMLGWCMGCKERDGRIDLEVDYV